MRQVVILVMLAISYALSINVRSIFYLHPFMFQWWLWLLVQGLILVAVGYIVGYAKGQKSK
jgi:hypothetical protein